MPPLALLLLLLSPSLAREPSFTELFSLLESSLADPAELTALSHFKSEFFAHLSSLQPLITSRTLDSMENIASYASGKNFDATYKSFAYGASGNTPMTKLLITGARGIYRAMGNYINGLGMSEVLDNEQTGLAAAYGNLFPSGFFYTDAKVTNHDLKFRVTPQGVFEGVIGDGNRYSFQKGLRTIALSHLYRLILGQGYAKFIIYEMMAGVGLDRTRYTINIAAHTMVRMVEVTEWGIKHSKGVFQSQSSVDRTKSVSRHKGYLRCQKKDEEDVILNSGAFSKADNEDLVARSFYEENKFVKASRGGVGN